MHVPSILSWTTILFEKKFQVEFWLLVFFHHPYKLADVFTKALPKTLFQVFRSKLGVHKLPPTSFWGIDKGNSTSANIQFASVEKLIMQYVSIQSAKEGKLLSIFVMWKIEARRKIFTYLFCIIFPLLCKEIMHCFILFFQRCNHICNIRKENSQEGAVQIQPFKNSLCSLFFTLVVAFFVSGI